MLTNLPQLDASKQPFYRAFPIDGSGKIAGPSTVLEAHDDDEAVVKARSLVDGRGIELWHGTNKLITLEPDKSDV